MALAPVYIFSSDDPFLKKEKSDEIINLAKQAYPNAEFMLFTTSDFGTGKTANLVALENELIDPGLFASDKIIKIYLDGIKEIPVQVLHLLAKRQRPGVVVIVEIGRINKTITNVQAKPYEEVLKGKIETKAKAVFSFLLNIHAHIETLYPPTDNQFLMWISNQARKYQLNLNPEVCQFLGLTCEGNLTAVDQFFKLVHMTSNDNQVTLQKAQAFIEQSSRHTTYEFIDAVLAPNSVKAMTILSSLVETENNLMSMLQNILFSFDNVIVAIKAAKADREFLSKPINYQAKRIFFTPFRINSPTTMDRVIFAAKNMPIDILDYLVEAINRASMALQVFDDKKALLALEDAALSVQYPAIRAFKEL